MTPLPRSACSLRRLLVFALVSLVAAVGGPAAQADPLYTITDLGTLPGMNSSVATAINNKGQVVGISYNNADATYFMSHLSPPSLVSNSSAPSGGQSFLYDGGHITQINPLGGLATSINDNGQVVGGTYTGINNSGTFVGGYSEGILNANGTTTTLAGPNIQAYGINNAGELAGTTAGPDANGDLVTHAAISLNGHVTDLTSIIPGGQYYLSTQALAINQQGDVLITTGGPGAGLSDVFLYLASAGKVTLTGLPLVATAINDKGQVVTADGMLYNNVNFYSLGTPQSLVSLIPPNSGWSNLLATAINDAGQIVGQGEYNNQEVAFLMTPEAVNAPEPGTLAIWGVMGIAVCHSLVRSKPRS